MGANLNESSAYRIAQGLQSFETVMDSVDKDCDMASTSSHRTVKGAKGCVRQIVGDLSDRQVFCKTVGRENYSYFPSICGDLIEELDYSNLYGWMNEKIKE